MNKKIDPWVFEEEFYPKGKRESRKERKVLQKKDLSYLKEKKSKQSILPSELSRGRALCIMGNRVEVDSEGERYFCSVRGFLKKEKRLVTNIVAVGDYVLFSKEDKLIFDVKERTSILSRRELLRDKEQIIAVNIDQVLIVASVFSPGLKPTLIDRYIIAARKGNMTPVIVLNKIDLLESHSQAKAEYEEFLKAYAISGVTILSVSATSGLGIEQLFAVMSGKTSCFSGQSGVGKSSLINATLGTHLRVGEIAKRTYKGAHVTTHAHLIPLQGGGFCIDTPGIKSFGMWGLKKEEIAGYFPEIKKAATSCKYPNCLHYKESDCGVKIAVEKGEISQLRFNSYISLLESEDIDVQ